MSEARVPAVTRPPVARTGSAAMALPAVIVDAGPVAVERFLEFFAGSIATGGRGRRTGGPWGGSCRGVRLGAWACARSPRCTWRPISARIRGRRRR